MFHDLEQETWTETLFTVEWKVLAEFFHEEVHVEGLKTGIQEKINGLLELPRLNWVSEEMADCCLTIFIEDIYVKAHVDELGKC